MGLPLHHVQSFGTAWTTVSHMLRAWGDCVIPRSKQRMIHNVIRRYRKDQQTDVSLPCQLGCLYQGTEDVKGMDSVFTRAASTMGLSTSRSSGRDVQRLPSLEASGAAGHIRADPQMGRSPHGGGGREARPTDLQPRSQVQRSSSSSSLKSSRFSQREARVPEEEMDGPLLTFKLTQSSSLKELGRLADLRAPVLNPIHIAALATRVSWKRKSICDLMRGVGITQHKNALACVQYYITSTS